MTTRLLARMPQVQDQALERPVGHTRARVKARDPDTYDDSNPSKLRASRSHPVTLLMIGSRLHTPFHG